MTIPQPWLATARQRSVVGLCAGVTRLRRAGPQEYAGACPKCGGTDRFHCGPQGWFCRRCRPLADGGWHDAIDFVQWLHGLDFAAAIAYLGAPPGSRPATAPGTRRFRPTRRMAPAAAPPGPGPAAPLHWWTPHRRLMAGGRGPDAAAGDAAASPAAAYLLGRGLEPPVWHAYRLGVARAYNRDSERAEPAIVLPWTQAGCVRGVRFRFIDPPGSQKTTALPGSRFAGLLYGGQTVLGCAEGHRTLVLCEGELNAASIWQVAHESNVDVLSLGSESARLTPAMVAYTRRFRHVLVWMDRPEVVRQLMARHQLAQLPAGGVASPHGQDANDLLQAGLLAAWLAAVRLRIATGVRERAGVYWDLWDQQRLPGRLDPGVQQVLAEAAARGGT